MTGAVARVRAWEALDSRGEPTVACRVWADDGSTAAAVVPAGASTGSHEAVERRDGGARRAGRGVRTAVAQIDDRLAAAVHGLPLGEVDAALATVDTSPGYREVGANAILAVSLAALRTAAASAGVGLARFLAGPDGDLLLPMPMVNIVSGGAHAGGLIDVQDFLVVPHAAPDFTTAIEWTAEIRSAARQRAIGAGHDTAALTADEGGLGLALTSNQAALDLLVAAIGDVGLAGDVGIAIDVAATEFQDGDTYVLRSEDRALDAAGLIAELRGWCEHYPILSIEDPVGEDDLDGWRAATERLAPLVQLIGDDLFATGEQRLRDGIAAGIADAVLIKVNQNGLVSGARTVHDLARDHGYRTVVSARSGDTEDAWLADLAVGWRSGQIKVGSTTRSERTAKWNRLLELEALEPTALARPFGASAGRDGPGA